MSAATPMDGIVILRVVRPASAILTKKLRRTASGWQVFGDYGHTSWVNAFEHPVADITDLAAVLTATTHAPQDCAIRSGVRPGFEAAVADPKGVRRRLHDRAGEPAAFEARARRWVACDLDSFELPTFVDPERDIDHVIDAALGQLPPAFADVSFYWQLTSGHGIKPGGRVRLWFWLSRPTTDRELKVWLAGAKVDPAVFAAVQPIYTAAPILPAGVPDFLRARSGVRAGWSDQVEVPPPEALEASHAGRGGNGGGSSGFVAPDVEAALARLGDPPAYPNGLGFHAPLKAAFGAAIRADGKQVDQAALLAMIDAALDQCGHTRQAGYIEARKRDARSWLQWFMDRATEEHDAAQAAAPSGPHYPRPFLSGAAASHRLRWTVRAYFDRVERNLEARDWIRAEADRIRPDVQRDLEARLTAKLIAKGESPDNAAEAAAERAEKAATRSAKRQARRRAVVLFGARAAKGIMPRIQIKGAAGLGKTQAIIEEINQRPNLWKYHISYYTKTLQLADGVAADFENGTVNAETAQAVEALANGVAPVAGARPRIRVIRGRQSEGMCHDERLTVIAAAQAAKVDSIYRAVCYSPAVGSAPESFCPFYAACKEGWYLAQFDKAPGLRIMSHTRLVLNQPDDLRLPVPDLVIVDESVISTMTTEARVDPAELTARATYACKNGEEHLVQEAMDVGAAVLTAVGAGPGGGAAASSPGGHAGSAAICRRCCCAGG